RQWGMSINVDPHLLSPAQKFQQAGVVRLISLYVLVRVARPLGRLLRGFNRGPFRSWLRGLLLQGQSAEIWCLLLCDPLVFLQDARLAHPGLERPFHVAVGVRGVASKGVAGRLAKEPHLVLSGGEMNVVERPPVPVG